MFHLKNKIKQTIVVYPPTLFPNINVEIAVYNDKIIEPTNRITPNIPAIFSGAVENEKIPSKA